MKRFLFGAALCCCLAQALPAAEPGSPVSVPADKYVKFTGAVNNNGILRLIRHVGSGTDSGVVLEAEEAEYLSLQARGRLIGSDPTAGNGRYIHFVNRADFCFNLAAAGRYQTWYRTFFPFKAHWSHEETMDGKVHRTVIDSAGDQPAEAWLWLKGPEYELTAGPHAFTLDNYNGGARLDKMVFLPTGRPAPEGIGPASTYTEAPAEGRVETTAIIPRGILRWDRLSLSAPPPPGSVEVLFSRDLGKNWSGLPADGSLAAVPVLPPGQYNGMKLAFVLKASADKVTPFVQDPRLHYLGPPPTVLETSGIRLDFAPTGELLSIRRPDLKNLAFSVESMRSVLLGLTVQDGGRMLTHEAGQATEQEVTDTPQGKMLRQKHLLADGKIEATVTVALDADLGSRWRVALVNHGSAPVVHVDFPLLHGLRVGAGGSDDWLFDPKVNGNLFKNPAQCPTLFSTSENYPRATAFKYISLWDQDGGLYLASHDPSFRDTGMTINRFDDTAIKVSFRQWTMVKPGESWQSGEFIVAPHAGDWHWDADRYRAFLSQCLKEPDNPRWLKEEFDGWDVHNGMFLPIFNWNALVKNFEKNRTWGIETIMSNRQGFDTNCGYCGLCPAPSPSWGTPEEFAQANQAVKERGGHTMFYINWHLWARQYSTGTRIGRNSKTLYPRDCFLPSVEWYTKNAVRRPDGSVALDTPYAPYEEHPLCNAATEYIDYHRYWADKYTREYHATGIYWDTLNDGYEACYATDHGHPDLGQWNNGSLAGLRVSNAAGRAADPHYACAGEGIADASVGQACNLWIASNNFSSYEFPRYTRPEQILVGGYWDNLSPKREELVNWMNFQFLTGVRFMGLTWDEYAVKMMNLRRATKQLLYPAVYRDRQGLTLTFPEGYKNPEPAPPMAPPDQRFLVSESITPQGMGIQAIQYRLQRPGTRATLINLLNTTGLAGGSVEIAKSECPVVRTAWLFDWEGGFAPLAVTDTGNGWKLAVPTVTQSTAVLVDRCEPLLTVTADSYIARGGRLPGKVAVRNLDPEPARGTLRLTWLGNPDVANAKGAPPTAPVSFGPIAPGATADSALELSIAADLPAERYEAEAVAESATGTSTRRLFWFFVGDPLRLGIEENVKESGLDIHLENKSTAPVTGECRLENVPQFTSARPVVAFAVKPGEVQTVTIPLAAAARFDLPVPVHVTVDYGNVTKRLVYSVQPTVVNGDFEVDLAGDGQPDFWTAYGSGMHGMLNYNQMRLDKTIRNTGNQSLCLDPPGVPGKTNLLFTLHGRMRPGKNYRVSVAIRREVEGPVYAQANGLQLGLNGKAGVWETFAGTIKATPTVLGPEEMGAYSVFLYNASTGKAWFDSVTIEEEPAR